ncbi:Erythromycin C-12 hydroxylase [Roseovarius albus]|uniref:Erythromycin C-12 hydroxylase n=1 Tax=Roseovarius albus TaxID=1247867 RepID=A0A1X6ZRV4_9RHOB|nr:cytochrome P450 [Roseovarius albus]SLN59603.1 Erythromycin C-12 hydroxylase [Roseovarius albus]
MNGLESKNPLRESGAIGTWLANAMMAAAPAGFAALRRFKPILKLRNVVIVSRYDDVREVFSRDEEFDTPYIENIHVLTGGEDFFLGLQQGAAYQAAKRAMLSVFRTEDLIWLGDMAEERAEKIVDESGAELEIVDQLVRKVTFDLYMDYIGIPQVPTENIDVWSTRLFEYQFAGSPKDKELRAEVDAIAPALRAHITDEIVKRKSNGVTKGDVLGRCLKAQSDGEAIFTDDFIRTNLLCMLVGGPPQVPMVVPQAMEQLLRRPKALDAARKAAEADDDDRLGAIVMEAARFDPLAPVLPRIVLRDTEIARGTSRQCKVPKGATIYVGFASAMMDPRRIGNPKEFDPYRGAHEYVHFGHGLHECFGLHMNRATLHRILKPVLKRKALSRSPGQAGRLQKRKIFADRLVVRIS